MSQYRLSGGSWAPWRHPGRRYSALQNPCKSLTLHQRIADVAAALTVYTESQVRNSMFLDLYHLVVVD